MILRVVEQLTQSQLVEEFEKLCLGLGVEPDKRDSKHMQQALSSWAMLDYEDLNTMSPEELAQRVKIVQKKYH